MAGSLRRGTLLESLPVTTLGVVSVLRLEPILFLLLSEEGKGKALGEEFLEIEEVETLLKECLAM